MKILIMLMQLFIATALIVNAVVVFKKAGKENICSPEIQNLEQLSNENYQINNKNFDLNNDISIDVKKLLQRFRVD